MCDVCILFLLLKQLERETTIDSLPFDSLSDESEEIFEKLSNDGINLKQNKVRILKDFLARLPYMLDKTCTVDNIRKGFVSVGMLDAKHHLWPDFNKILKTKRQNITKTEMELIEKTFSQLYNVMKDRGYIPESLFDDLGYPKDVVSGKLFERHQGIEAEWMQRAKILTHEFQKQLREERERKTVEEFEEKQNKLRQEIDELIQLNKETEQMLKEQIAVRLHGNLLHTCNNNSNESLLTNATLDMIKGLTVPYMKAFIHV
jgi:hypothetical protein